jgi:hypothetical protein
LFVFDESQSWLLFLWHEERAFFWPAQSNSLDHAPFEELAKKMP